MSRKENRVIYCTNFTYSILNGYVLYKGSEKNEYTRLLAF